MYQSLSSGAYSSSSRHLKQTEQGRALETTVWAEKQKETITLERTSAFVPHVTLNQQHKWCIIWEYIWTVTVSSKFDRFVISVRVSQTKMIYIVSGVEHHTHSEWI